MTKLRRAVSLWLVEGFVMVSKVVGDGLVLDNGNGRTRARA